MEIFDTRTLKWSISNIYIVIQKGVGMVQINN